MQIASGFHSSFDQSKIYFQRWQQSHSKATVIVTHGQAEHIGCYQRLIDALLELPVDVIAWDMRGHGKSDGSRGYAAHFQDYIRDFEGLLGKLTTDMRLMEKPIFLIAHSMGALVQFKTLCEKPGLPIAGQILSGPLFGLAMQVPALKDMAAQWIEQLVPKLTLGNEILPERLTRDLDVLREFDNDPLRHNRISATVYLGSLRAASEVRAMASRVETPTLLLMAENDPITSVTNAKEVFEKIGAQDKTAIYYPERMHEIFNDIGRDQVFKDLRSWIGAKI